ncbi:MAG: tyrosine-type recombinase/integrase [Rhizobiaceae bacterium]
MSDHQKSVRITKRVVDAIKPDGTDFYLFDGELIGFGVRVRKSGTMSYIVRYRATSGKHAPVSRMTIAKVGKVTPDQARERAKELLADVVKGSDPAKERSEYRKAPTFEEVAGKFLEHVEAKRKPNTAVSYQQLLAKHAYPAFGKKKAAEVSSDDVEKLHLKLAEKPMTANRVRAIISSMYNWATSGKKKHLPAGTANPAEGLAKYTEQRRERFLTTEEISRLAAAISEGETTGIPWEPDPEKKVKHARKPQNRFVKLHPSAALAMRLLLLTGARLREVLHLKWEYVDFERGLLLLPDSKTGRKTVILNAPALALLTEAPRLGAYVIAGETAGTKDEKPRADLKKPWAAVTKRAGLDNLRIHDLRHSFASFGAGGGMGLPVIGKLLGHTQPATTARYAHLDADPLRKASNVIGNTIAAAMGEKVPSAEVIKLKRGQAS